MSLKFDLIETSVNFVLLVELPGSCIENINVTIQDLSYICVDALKKKRNFYEFMKKLPLKHLMILVF